jgi:hypothetical protein
VDLSSDRLLMMMSVYKIVHTPTQLLQDSVAELNRDSPASMLQDCPDSLFCIHTYGGPESVPAITSREAAGYKHGSLLPERIFNYRLSRARKIIENVFCILSFIFRVLLKTIALNPDKVESVVLSCIYLHNFLYRNAISKGFYTRPGSL